MPDEAMGDLCRAKDAPVPIAARTSPLLARRLLRSMPLARSATYNWRGAAVNAASQQHGYSANPLLTSHFWMRSATRSLFWSIMTMCELPLIPRPADRRCRCCRPRI